MANAPVIKTTGLSYHYSKEAQTLFDINLHVEKGSIYGFLGPNGSGKTTTLSLLLGLLGNQQGDIEIFGQHLHSNRIDILKKIGSLVETPSLYAHLTAKENLEIYRTVYGASKERVNEVLKITGIEGTGQKTVKKFSLGMKQRLSIALALLPNPELLILDEPSNGLDPAGIIELRELIKRLNKDYGMTILISSHLLIEVEKMVSHVGIIFKGKMLFQGSLAELHLFEQKGSKLLVDTSDNEAALKLLQEHHPEWVGNTLALPLKDREQIACINRTLTQNNLDVYLLHPKENNLEQLFIDLTSTKS
ncbi:ATP-binding cassette domain-containing protein [Segetibacter aerophilus]|uniref:ABC transporter ATP-binding protein n=1 Tax=Segetibacter aerophilus TaxID=670293 RepID=A0A512BGS4_9BACT|nr:ATP-binding cassette domain-containing protein [Segetibacter aerophilus]GEO11075.1 ABC transporter ATP-binding protein [Segetibacter aerophilus]